MSEGNKDVQIDRETMMSRYFSLERRRERWDKLARAWGQAWVRTSHVVRTVRTRKISEDSEDSVRTVSEDSVRTA